MRCIIIDRRRKRLFNRTPSAKERLEKSNALQWMAQHFCPI
jgi:hypothetical protein